MKGAFLLFSCLFLCIPFILTQEEVKLEELEIPLDEYDSEEFEGIEEAKQQKRDTFLKDLQQTGQKQGADEKFEFSFQEKEDYYLEIGFIVFILAYIINFWFGKKSNEAIAQEWAASAVKIFSSQFSQLSGDSKQICFKENHSTFIFKGTGRINCIGMQATLQLKKRHDLFSVISSFFFPTQDTLIIDVLMNNEAMDTFVFALIKKKEEKKFRKDNADVANFTPSIPSQVPIPSLTAFTEGEELLDEFFPEEVITTLNTYQNEFISMHFSDQGISSPSYKKSLKFTFKLPPNPDKLTTLTKMVFFFVDLVARTKLGKNSKAKAMKHRTQVEEVKLKETLTERQEAAQQKKIEKRIKEKEELKKLTDEERTKREEKLLKKEQRKRQAGIVKVVKA